MDFFDFPFPAGSDSAAPPPMGEPEFDTGEYNLCYPYNFIGDVE
jgi:hypothetical protein